MHFEGYYEAIVSFSPEPTQPIVISSVSPLQCWLTKKGEFVHWNADEKRKFKRMGCQQSRIDS